MDRDRRERRRRQTRLERPPLSPVNHLILTVVLVLAATAAATAFLGPGYDDATPHGQVLGQLDRVARAQADFHADSGRFAEWIRTLEVEADHDVTVNILYADSTRWEAIASHQMGLTCSQSGRLGARGAVRERPVCYTEPGG